MKNRIVTLITLFLLMSFATGLVTACNINTILPFGDNGGYNDRNDRDNEDEDDEEETKKSAKKTKAVQEDDEDDANDGSSDTKAPAGDDSPYGKATVTTAFKYSHKTKYLGKVTCSYPKITIEGVDTSDINSELAASFKARAKKHKVTYAYYIGKNYISILITLENDMDFPDYEFFVYNLSRETGKKMTRDQMFKALGTTRSAFEARAKKAIQSYWKKNDFISMDKSGYNKVISSSSISKTIPYVNSKGKLCYLYKQMYTPVGGNYYDVHGGC